MSFAKSLEEKGFKNAPYPDVNEEISDNLLLQCIHRYLVDFDPYIVSNESDLFELLHKRSLPPVCSSIIQRGVKIVSELLQYEIDAINSGTSEYCDQIDDEIRKNGDALIILRTNILNEIRKSILKKDGYIYDKARQLSQPIT